MPELDQAFKKGANNKDTGRTPVGHRSRRERRRFSPPENAAGTVPPGGGGGGRKKCGFFVKKFVE